jgi:hypothetical protein
MESARHAVRIQSAFHHGLSLFKPFSSLFLNVTRISADETCSDHIARFGSPS